MVRTYIVIDDISIAHAMRATGGKTERNAVELVLKMLLRLADQADIRKARGKLDWSGDLDDMRTDG